MAALIAFDPIEQFKLPCMLVGGMPYYVKLQILCAAPLVLSVMFCVVSFVWHMVRSHYKHKRDLIKLQAAAALRRINEASGANVVARKKRNTGGGSDDDAETHASHYRINMRASAKRGMFRCISIVSLIMDICYPSVSRTILQIFRCRELGTPSSSQMFLEADLKTICYDQRWRNYLALAIPAIVFYCCGIPFFFYWIVRRYKKKKKMDDENIKRIIGWMHRPLRPGCEYFMSVELLRKLILTGCIGFMARSPSRFCRTLFSGRAALHCTATARILIPAECSAIP